MEGHAENMRRNAASQKSLKHRGTEDTEDTEEIGVVRPPIKHCVREGYLLVHAS